MDTFLNSFTTENFLRWFIQMMATYYLAEASTVKEMTLDMESILAWTVNCLLLVKQGREEPFLELNWQQVVIMQSFSIIIF